VRRAAVRSTLALLLALGGLPARAQSAGAGPRFEALSVADGVWVLRPVAGARGGCNSLLVERQDGLLVVDSQPSPEDARELLSVVARTSPKPVRYLVLSHAHAESAGGASAFPESTLVIGSSETLAALRDPDFDFGAETRDRSEDPRTWVAPEIRMPALVIYGRAELEDPLNRVELLPLGHAHSTSDLAVVVSGPGVLWAGAVLFPDRNPYAGDANVGGWVATLNHIAKLQPAVVVPQRGDPLDTRGVRLQRDALAWVRGQVELAFIDGVPPEQIPDRILGSDELATHFDPDAAPPFLRILFQQAVDEAVAERRKRGLL